MISLEDCVPPMEFDGPLVAAMLRATVWLSSKGELLIDAPNRLWRRRGTSVGALTSVGVRSNELRI